MHRLSATMWVRVRELPSCTWEGDGRLGDDVERAGAQPRTDGKLRGNDGLGGLVALGQPAGARVDRGPRRAAACRGADDLRRADEKARAPLLCERDELSPARCLEREMVAAAPLEAQGQRPWAKPQHHKLCDAAA